MAPPPMYDFVTRDDLMRYCQKWAYNHGYALVINNSKANKYVVLGCDRGGVSTASERWQDGRDLRKIGCEVKVCGKFDKKRDLWTFTVKGDEHNHGVSNGPRSHPVHRRLTKQNIDVVASKIGEHLSGRQIASAVVENDKLACPNDRNIWNAKSQYIRDEVKGKRLIDVLFAKLKESDWVFDYKFKEDNHLDALFMAHPDSIKMARKFHHLAIMDSTYKTNVYNWPMFQVVGATSTEQTFTIAMAFLAREVDSYYDWAMECLMKHVWSPERVPKVFITDRERALAKAIKKAAPETNHLLCSWHIESNIVAECKKLFANDEVEVWEKFRASWKKLVNAPTQDDYNKQLIKVRVLLEDKESVLDYLEQNILPVKEQFMLAWCGVLPSFGH